MKSIKELYRIGTGPSSSHTMGPRKAAEMFVVRHPDATKFKVNPLRKSCRHRKRTHDRRCHH